MPDRIPFDVVIYADVGLPFDLETTEGVGGSEFAAIRLAETLAREKIDVLLLTRKPWTLKIKSPFLACAHIGFAHEFSCHTLVTWRYSQLPTSLSFKRHVVSLHDMPGNVHDHLSIAAENGCEFVAVSAWQKSLFPKEWSITVISPLLPPEVDSAPTLEKKAGVYLFPSAAIKGLSETIAAWTLLRLRSWMEGTELRVLASGYDSLGSVNRGPVRDDLGITFLPNLNFSEFLREIQTCEAIFVVNTFPETYGVPFAIANAVGTRAHVLCTQNPGALPTTMPNGPIHTEFASFFDDIFAHRGNVCPGIRRPVHSTPLISAWKSILALPEPVPVTVPEDELRTQPVVKRRTPAFKVASSYPDLWALEDAIKSARVANDPKAIERLVHLHMRGIKHGDGYGTHVPLLAAVISGAPLGPVLELGTGYFSTPLLHQMCKANGQTLYSLDTSADWIANFRDLAEDPDARHYFVQVNDPWKWEEAIDDLPIRDWAVTVIDQTPDPTRIGTVRKLANRSAFLVVHDTCNTYFDGMDAVLDEFEFRYDYTNMVPVTTAVSNRMPIPGGKKEK